MSGTTVITRKIESDSGEANYEDGFDIFQKTNGDTASFSQGYDHSTTSFKLGTGTSFGSTDSIVLTRLGLLTAGTTPITGANAAGRDTTIHGGKSTGTGAGGSIIFQTAPAGDSGSTANALTNAMTIDSTAINVGTIAEARTITVGNVTGATAVNLNAGTGGIALASTGAGDITINSDDTMLLDADGVLELNSSAGAISIGNNDIDQPINIGTQGERTINVATGAFADTVNIGNVTGATAVNVTTGSGGLTMTTGTNGAISIDPHGTGNLTLGSADNGTTAIGGNAMNIDAAGALQINSSAGAISIGNDDIDQAINIGTQGERTINVATGAFADTVNIGNSTGASAVNVTTGSGGLTMTTGTNGAISIDPHGTGNLTLGSADNATTAIGGNAMNIDAAGALQINSSAGAISIGNDDIDQAINIGTQGERTINVATGSFADTVNIGNSTGASAVNVTTGSGGLTMTTGTNGAISIDPHGTGNLTLGSADNATTAIGGNAMNIDAAGALQINSSAGAISIGNDDIDQAINIGTQGERTINVATGSFADTVNIGNSTGASAVNVTTGSGGLTMTTGTNGAISIDPHGTGNLTLGSADNGTTAIGGNALTITSAGATTLSSGGALAIDTDGTNAINFGTEAAAKTITVGNAASTLVDINAIAIDVDAAGALTLDGAGGVNIGTATSGVAISIGHGTSEVTVNDNLTVTGDLKVNGTTTTVNSTTVTIDDPIFTLGGDIATEETSKDRGIEARYGGVSFNDPNYDINGSNVCTVTRTGGGDFNAAAGDTVTIASSGNATLNGTYQVQTAPGATSFTITTSGISATTVTGSGTAIVSKNVFFGLDQNADVFTYLSRANNNGEVLSGTVGDVVFGAGTFSNMTASGTLGVTGVGTFTATSVHTGGITSGGNIVSDTDSTDSLGTSGVRWANVFTDSIGDSGQALDVAAPTLSFDAATTIDTSGDNALTISSGTATTTMTAGTVAMGTNATIGGTLGVDGITTLGSSTGVTVSAAGVVNINNTTASNSSTSGALIVDGGAGIAGDLSVGDDIRLTSDSAVLSFGADSEITLTHVHDSGLTLKHTATTDDKPIVLTLATGEADIAINDIIGTINFQAPDEGAGTDAILVCAGIDAVSEGDFSSSNNATKLSFKTGASEAAAEKMKLSSTGVLTLNGTSGSIVIPNAGTIGSASDTDAISISSGGVVNITATSGLSLAGTPVTSTAAELNIMDGGSSIVNVSVAGSDGVVYNDAGTMKQVDIDSLKDYIQGGSATSTRISLDGHTSTSNSYADGQILHIDETTIADSGTISSKNFHVAQIEQVTISNTHGSAQTYDNGASLYIAAAPAVANNAAITNNYALHVAAGTSKFADCTLTGTLGVTGVGTFTATSVHTGGITSGSNIVSDTDSTDDLGTTGIRWANVFTDSIGDSGQTLDVAAPTLSFDAATTIDTSGDNALTISSGTATTTVTAGLVAMGTNATVGGTLGVTGLSTLATVDINGGNIDNTIIGASSASAGTFSELTMASDKKLKTNIKGIKDPLEKVLNLRGVNFDWKDKKKYNDRKQIGFIAQEVEKVVPELVTEKGNIKTVSYPQTVSLLVEAIKEQNDIINDLIDEVKYIKENYSTKTKTKPKTKK